MGYKQTFDVDCIEKNKADSFARAASCSELLLCNAFEDLLSFAFGADECLVPP